MRKFILTIISILLISTVAIALVACGEKADEIDQIMNKISYREECVMTGDNTDFHVKYVKGVKEESFVADGKCENVKEFASITLRPINVDMLGYEYSYTLTGTEGSLSGKFTKNVLGGSYSHNITVPTAIGVVTGVSIIYNEQNVAIELKDRTADGITSDKAIEYAYNALKEELKDSFVDGEFNREVYVRFINDRQNPQSKYLWYVSFMKDNAHYNSVLIDPESGKIITK